MGTKTGRVTRQDMRTLLALYYSDAGRRQPELGYTNHRGERPIQGGGVGYGRRSEDKGQPDGADETSTDFDPEGRSKPEFRFVGGIPGEGDSHGPVILHTHSGESVRAKTKGQQNIVDATAQNDIVFAIGPAGTGKTYTSVALAVKALKDRRVKKIILARPAVEAGENLGFLPGDLKEKIDPYLRPLYDALEEMIETDKLEHLMAKNTIEIAPLAYMRGRTLNNAFVILDEAQNATNTQMKMFLTRIGFHSQAIITGDITQTDLPKKQQSGLISIQEILQNVNGISFVYLDPSDVVRHKLVRDIIDAYEKFESEQEDGQR